MTARSILEVKVLEIGCKIAGGDRTECVSCETVTQNDIVLKKKTSFRKVKAQLNGGASKAHICASLAHNLGRERNVDRYRRFRIG